MGIGQVLSWLRSQAEADLFKAAGEVTERSKLSSKLFRVKA